MIDERPLAGAHPPEPSARDRSGTRLVWVLALAWIAGAAGVGLMLAGLGFGAAAVALEQPDRLGAMGTIALTGAVVALLGLGAGAARSIHLRRGLGDDRYRGPSVLVVLAIVLVAGNALSVPLLGGWTALLTGAEPPGEPGIWAILFLTPAMLLAALSIFVAAPRALPGLVLAPSRRIGRQALLGLGVGAAAWIGATLLGAIIALIVTRLTGEQPPPQLIIELITGLNPVVVVLAAVVAAPIVEELFFRGFVYNAWLREYGPRRALIGSSLLFGVIHITNPSPVGILSLVPILLLAFVLGYAYARTRSLVTCIAMHATFNGLAIAVLFAAPGLLDR